MFNIFSRISECDFFKNEFMFLAPNSSVMNPKTRDSSVLSLFQENQGQA